jgi:hypothetical protein
MPLGPADAQGGGGGGELAELSFADGGALLQGLAELLDFPAEGAVLLLQGVGGSGLVAVLEGLLDASGVAVESLSAAARLLGALGDVAVVSAEDRVGVGQAIGNGERDHGVHLLRGNMGKLALEESWPFFVRTVNRPSPKNARSGVIPTFSV